MLVRACVRLFVRQNKKKTAKQNLRAHTRRIIRGPSLFPITGFITPDDTTRLLTPLPTAIDSRVEPVAVAEARRATMLLLPTRDVGGRRPDGRGPTPAPGPPATNEALDAVARGGGTAVLLC